MTSAAVAACALLVVGCSSSDGGADEPSGSGPTAGSSGLGAAASAGVGGARAGSGGSGGAITQGEAGPTPCTTCDGGSEADAHSEPEPVVALPCQPQPAQPYEFAQDGVTYRVVDGDIFAVNGSELTFVQQLYDPDYYAQLYARDGDGLWLLDGADRIAVLDEFADDFEAPATVRDLFPRDFSGWHHITAQSPAAPTIDEYNALADCVMSGSCDFIDNRIELTPLAASGEQALRFSALPATATVDPSKMSIGNELICFAKADSLWLSFRVFTEAGMPGTLADIESKALTGSGGPRLTLYGGSLGVELKFGDKPKYRQEAPRPWPIGVWVDVKLHLVLDDTDAGVIQLWQDGELVIDTHGRNLPLPDIVLNSLEIGISATIEGADLRIDDVRISREAL